MPRTDAKSWHPTVEQCTTVIYELKHNKAPDAGEWTTESAKAAFLLPHLGSMAHPFGTSASWGRPGKDWHAHTLVCLKKLSGGHRPILISSVWIKLLSRLLLKEAGTPLKELVKETQFGTGQRDLVRIWRSSWRIPTPH